MEQSKLKADLSHGNFSHHLQRLSTKLVWVGDLRTVSEGQMGYCGECEEENWKGKNEIARKPEYGVGTGRAQPSWWKQRQRAPGWGVWLCRGRKHHLYLQTHPLVQKADYPLRITFTLKEKSVKYCMKWEKIQGKSIVRGRGTGRFKLNGKVNVKKNK